MVSWALVALVAMTPASARYDGHKVVRVYPADTASLRMALNLADDVWTERPRPGRVDLRMSPEGLAALDMSGIDYDVIVHDVQLAVDAERSRLVNAPTPTNGTWFADFKTFQEIDGHLDTLAGMGEGITEVFTVGDSLEGRTVRGIKIGRSADGKAALLITGTMHAREWLSPMTVMCIADRLIAGYEGTYEDLLDTIDVYVIPVLNPDGYVVSWGGDRYWRKNTRGGYGVDLNRNFGYEWGGEGASPYPQDENFRGDAAFSEPETQILRDFVQARPEFVAHIDYHSYAELVIYPWGYGYDSAPDEPLLSELATSMASAASASQGHGYSPIQGADFYPAAGAVDDWAYGDEGLMAFTIELRGNDFVIAPSNILPACEESLAATLELADWTAEQSDVMEPPGGTGGETDGGEEGGETGGGETADDAGDDDGAAADDDDDDSDDEGESDDEGDGWSGTTDPALPSQFGATNGDMGCTCRSPATTPAASLLLLGLLGLRRRRADVDGGRA